MSLYQIVFKQKTQVIYFWAKTGGSITQKKVSTWQATFKEL